MSRFTLFLIALGAFLFGFSYGYIPAADPDLGWHLFGGEYIARSGAVPTSDPINTFNTHWHDYHWLGQLLLYWGKEAFGLYGLRICHGIVVGMTAVFFILILTSLVRHDEVESKWQTPLVVSAFLFTFWWVGSVTSIRPTALSMFFLTVWLYVLVKKPGFLTEICTGFIIAVLLVNIHVYWIFVPVFWFILRTIPALFYQESRGVSSRLSLYLPLCLFAASGFVSPYGLLGSNGQWAFENYALLFDYLTMPPVLKEFIREMKPGIESGGVLPVLFLLIFFLTARSRITLSRERTVSLLLFAFGALLFFRSVKFASVFGLCMVPWVILSLHDQLEKLPSRWQWTSRHDTALASLFLACTAFTAYYWFPVRGEYRTFEETHLPIRACQKIPELQLHPEDGRSHLRVLTSFTFGGWCRYALYQKAPSLDARVTTDGRTQWVNPDLYQHSFDLFNLRPGWYQTLLDWDPDVYLVKKELALAQFLVKIPEQWSLVYEDEAFALFVPKRPLPGASQ